MLYSGLVGYTAFIDNFSVLSSFTLILSLSPEAVQWATEMHHWYVQKDDKWRNADKTCDYLDSKSKLMLNI